MQVAFAIGILSPVKRPLRKQHKPSVTVGSRTKALRVERKKITALVDYIARTEGAVLEDVDVAVVDSREMAGLNRRYLGRKGATDVISFDLSDDSDRGISPQIVVCGEVVTRQAARLGHGAGRELLLYVTHGLLHLMGYDDATEKASEKMQARGEQLLEEFLSETRRGK